MWCHTMYRLTFDIYYVRPYYIRLGDIVPMMFSFNFYFIFFLYLKKRNLYVVADILAVSYSCWVALITAIGLASMLTHVLKSGGLNFLSFTFSQYLGHAIQILRIVFVFRFLLALWSSWSRECNPFQDGIGRFQMKGMCFMFSQEIIDLSLLPNLLGWKLNPCLKNRRYYWISCMFCQTFLFANLLFAGGSWVCNQGFLWNCSNCFNCSGVHHNYCSSFK